MLPYSVEVKKKKTFSREKRKRHYYRLKMKISNLSLLLKEEILLPS